MTPYAPDADDASSADGNRPGGIVGLLPEVWPRGADGLEIRSGGAVAVDTETLRHTAGRIVAAKAELDSIADRLGSLHSMLWIVGSIAEEAESSARALWDRLLATRREAERIASSLREAAVVYELVELNVEHRNAVLSGDGTKATILDARMERLRETYPDAWTRALESEFERTVMWPSELVRQATETGVVVGAEFGDPAAIVAGASAGLLTLGGAALLGIAGPGRLARDARLTGTPGPVEITPVAPGRSLGAPRSLTGVAERMPGAGDARVRVERYTMPDGTRQFAVYVAGTQSLALGGDDPWDNASNTALYAGNAAESYVATEQAVAAAGARPGDVVHAFGHSQGAMIAAHLALESDYDTRTLVSFGSPVSADVSPETLSVSVRHTDDPVTALAGGGHAAAVGAPGSFTVERAAHPAPGLDDLAAPAHRMVEYAETAQLIDASADPRVGGLRDLFTELAGADSVEVTEYSARRADEVSPSSEAAG